ncbi:MAG TPA: acyl-CoA reductase, partial [Candidatus Acidoferrales bacterium]|nr:acyl-CoA reductase [Candidatus Acidoferrales bacterium]
ALGRIAERTGYSLPVLEYALDRLFSSITQESLAAVLEDELGSLDCLDGFVARRGRPRAWARPIGSICIVSSRTTVGVALVPAVFALCAKCDILVKDREDALVGAFFATLAQELDEMTRAARCAVWEGESPPVPLRDFAGVVAFGSDATLRAIAAQLNATARFAGYGAKASVGYVGRDALDRDAAIAAVCAGAARDLVLYDSEGCLSLHALFVQRGGRRSVAEFAAALARAVERAAIEFPASADRAESALRVAATRDLAAFRAAGGAGAVYADARATHCVVLDPPAAEPPAFLPRTIAVRAVDDAGEAAAYLARHDLAIEAVAVAGASDGVVAEMLPLGVSRIVRFGSLQAPPLGAFHGGRPRVAEFVAWIGDES